MEKIVVDKNNELTRLDKFLTSFLIKYNFSRNYIQKMIEDENVLVNDSSTSSNYKVQLDDVVTIKIPEKKKLDILPENIEIEILYEDKDLVIINKPNGIVVHPSLDIVSGTIVNALLFHIKDLSGIAGIERPGIVHRLDKFTTGVMIVAKNDLAHNKLTKMLANKEIKKKYLAIVSGELEYNKGTIDAPIGRSSNDRKKMCVTEKKSRNAITHFNVISKNSNYSFLKLNLETGRTHQIRVHLNYIKHPIIGDNIYGYKSEFDIDFGQYLHAYSLEFIHPISGANIFVKVDPPSKFNDKLKEIDLIGGNYE